MSVAGYVLAGGNSTRMGRDKDLLQIDGVALVQHNAALVHAAADRATIVGDPEKYSGLGYPIVADRRPGNGPLGGMESALMDSTFEWNLIVACDMGSLSAEFLAVSSLQQVRFRAEPNCLI